MTQPTHEVTINHSDGTTTLIYHGKNETTALKALEQARTKNLEADYGYYTKE